MNVFARQALVGFFLVAPAAACAQRPIPLDSGQIVRVRLAARTERGRLLAAFSPESVQLRFCVYPANPCSDTSGTRRAIDPRTLLGLDVRIGSRLREGAAIGFSVGAALGLLFHAFAEGVCDTRDCVPSYPSAVLPPALLLGGLGALFGDSQSIWRPVPLGAPTRGVLPN